MPKISLCLIVGNVEEYIARCLTSFLPIADEVVLVRAIGSQEPDQTINIARVLCAAHGKPFVFGEYKNAPERSDWPHVDDFAAARQMSFDLASSEYCFWCDTDDILKEGAEKIRNHARTGSYACYFFPYDIFGKNVVVQRERMMLKGSGRWENPVHEAFKFHIEPMSSALDDGVIIQHRPELMKNGSNDRNLRILESIPKDKLTRGLKYHLFGELLGANRIPEAVTIGVELVQDKELGKPERYDVVLSLFLQTKDLEQRRALLHAAHQIDPTRREALGVLACTAIDSGEPEHALAYARQMMALPEPDMHVWNSRIPFYGYVGNDIFQQALRACGRNEDAEAVRRKFLSDHKGPRISLLHATRGRPEMASKARKNWFDLAEKPELIEHIFAFDADDKESLPLCRFHHVVIRVPGRGCVHAWNCAAGVAEGQVYVQVSDDWTPPPMWDKLIIERLGDLTEPKVLAVSDGTRKDDLLCMAICTRTYYVQDWFMFHPRFTGVYSDNYFTEVAKQRGALVDGRDIVFMHRHPAFGTAVMDETYARQNAPERYAEGKAVYDELMQGKDWSTVPGFFNYWPFYENLAKRLNDGDEVAEVGVWLGRSVIFLAQELKRLGKHKVKIYAVDHFKGESNQREHEATVKACGGSLRASFERNLWRCGVADMVEIIDGDSAESASRIADGSLAFAYIDAAHDYESVKRDIAAWRNKIKAETGILAGHDAECQDVRKAVSEAFGQAAACNGSIWMVGGGKT